MWKKASKNHQKVLKITFEKATEKGSKEETKKDDNTNSTKNRKKWTKKDINSSKPKGDKTG